MSHAATPDLMRLSEGIVALCDVELVRAVQRAERPFAPQLLRHPNRPYLGGGMAPYQPSRLVASDYMRREHAILNAACDDLLKDFRRRVEDGQIHLSGMQTYPERQDVRSAVPGVWMAEYVIDWEAEKLVGAGRGYSALRLSAQPVALTSAAVLTTASASDPGVPGTTLPLTLRAETMRQLSDEEVLLLLEEYARRVVEEEGSELKMPVKVSFIPIIRRRMRYRFKVGEQRSTLDSEAASLETWIKSKTDGHQTPTARHIANELRDDYRDLKTASTRRN